jgi:hypothetical protein
VPLEADDLDRLVKTLESMLDRFKESGSIFLRDCTVPIVTKSGKGKEAKSIITHSLPKESKSKEIRESWKNNRRLLPDAGIVFPDGSILTILFICKSLPIPKKLSPIAKDIEIYGSAGCIAYIDQYSYCFYPNSKNADAVGYFRYDFHVDKMGSGDLGEHTYFHFHRSLEGEFRHATGPMFEFDKIVSGIERVLAPKYRQERLEKTFLSGKFEKLLLDLTSEGIDQLAQSMMKNKSVHSKFKHQAAFEAFMDARL